MSQGLGPPLIGLDTDGNGQPDLLVGRGSASEVLHRRPKVTGPFSGSRTWKLLGCLCVAVVLLSGLMHKYDVV